MNDVLVLDYQPPQQRTRGLFYYGWVNVAVAAVAMVATLPGRPQGVGVITESLLGSLNISRSLLGVQNAWATLLGSTFCLACGPLIDRFGARVVLTAILAGLSASVLAMSRVTGPIGLLITLVLTRGFGQSALSVVSLALVGIWFSRRLPVAMGVFSVLMGIGFVAAFRTIGYPDPQHWRHVWGTVGWVLAALAPLSWLLARSTPESIGRDVDGIPRDEVLPAKNDEAPQSGHTLAQALATPLFWGYALSASTFGMISAALMLFNESVLKEHGFDRKMAVNVITIIMITSLAANFLGGLLGRLARLKYLMGGAMFLLAVSLCCLPVANNVGRINAYSILMGFSSGFVTVCFFACWGDAFGRRHLGKIQGAAQALTVLTSSIGPWFLAQCVEHFGSSTPFLYILAPVVGILGLFCVFSPAPRPPLETSNIL